SVSSADEMSEYEIAMEVLYLPASLLTTVLLFFGALRLRALKGTLLLKAGFLLEIVAVPPYLGFIGLWIHENPEFAAAPDASPMRPRESIGFFLFMLCYCFNWVALIWLLRRGKTLPLIKGHKVRAAYEQPIAGGTARVASASMASPAAMAPQLLIIAVALVIGAIVIAAGGVQFGFALLNYPAGSNEFWGWLGGAIGCIVGGLGAVFGTWNSYRQLEGSGDLMHQPTWNFLDRIMAGYGTIGLAALAVALAFASRLSQTSVQALLLLGGMIVFQAALFLGIRFLARRAAQAGQLQQL